MNACTGPDLPLFEGSPGHTISLTRPRSESFGLLFQFNPHIGTRKRQSVARDCDDFNVEERVALVTGTADATILHRTERAPYRLQWSRSRKAWLTNEKRPNRLSDACQR
jgi:hypothetical protein